MDKDIKEKEAKQYIKFVIMYIILLIYLYCFAIILKRFAFNDLHSLILSSVLYIPILLYVYISTRKRNITAGDIGITKDNWEFVLIFLSLYIFLFFYKREYTLNNIINWIFYLVCTGITEEIIFRGYIYERSKQFMSRKQAILWNCLLFTIMHIAPQSVLQGFTFKDGLLYFINNIGGMSFITWIFIIIKEKSNTILIPVLLHAIINYL